MLTITRWGWRKIRHLARRPQHWGARLLLLLILASAAVALVLAAWPLILVMTAAWALGVVLVSRLRWVGLVATLVLLVAAEIAVRVMGGGPGIELAPVVGAVVATSEHHRQAFSRRPAQVDPLDSPGQGASQ